MENNYTSYYLKFSSEIEAQTKLTEVNYYRTIEQSNPETGEVETRTYYTTGDVPGDIDVIGVIYNDDAVFETGEDGMPVLVSEPTQKDGWHINIILAGDLPASLNSYKVIPQQPYRIFAGQG